MNDYQTSLKTAMKKDGRENEKHRTSAELTHEILSSEDSAEIKVMRLHTECGFGMARATELVTGKGYQKPIYKNAELNKDLGRFYKIDT